MCKHMWIRIYLQINGSLFEKWSFLNNVVNNECSDTLWLELEGFHDYFDIAVSKIIQKVFNQKAFLTLLPDIQILLMLIHNCKDVTARRTFCEIGI